MNRIAIIILFFALPALLAGACSGLRKGGNAEAPPPVKESREAVLQGDYNRILYKAGMEAFGRHFSGIFVIKPQPADTSFRVVVLSEFGLNLMDMTLDESSVVINHCQDFLDRRIILKSIERNIRMLVFMPGFMHHSGRFTEHKTGNIVYKSRKGLAKYLYFYNGGSRPVRIEQRRCFGSKHIVRAEYDSLSVPVSVTCTSRPFGQTMKLSLLNIE